MKYGSIVILLSALFFLFSSPIFAQADAARQLEAFAGREGAGYAAPQDPRLVVAGVIRTALTIVGILFVAYLVYAGFIIMTASGEEEKVKKGTNTIRRAVIGIVVVALSYSITRFVTRYLERAVKGEPFLEIDIEEGYRASAPLCCEWQKGGRIEGGFVPDQENCRALCENSGAEPRSCRSYRTRQSDSCPLPKSQ
jgi:uncharacterized membrane protein YwzB